MIPSTLLPDTLLASIDVDELRRYVSIAQPIDDRHDVGGAARDDVAAFAGKILSGGNDLLWRALCHVGISLTRTQEYAAFRHLAAAAGAAGAEGAEPSINASLRRLTASTLTAVEPGAGALNPGLHIVPPTLAADLPLGDLARDVAYRQPRRRLLVHTDSLAASGLGGYYTVTGTGGVIVLGAHAAGAELEAVFAHELAHAIDVAANGAMRESSTAAEAFADHLAASLLEHRPADLAGAREHIVAARRHALQYEDLRTPTTIRGLVEYALREAFGLTAAPVSESPGCGTEALPPREQAAAACVSFLSTCAAAAAPAHCGDHPLFRRKPRRPGDADTGVDEEAD